MAHANGSSYSWLLHVLLPQYIGLYFCYITAPGWVVERKCFPTSLLKILEVTFRQSLNSFFCLPAMCCVHQTAGVWARQLSGIRSTRLQDAGIHWLCLRLMMSDPSILLAWSQDTASWGWMSSQLLDIYIYLFFILYFKRHPCLIVKTPGFVFPFLWHSVLHTPFDLVPFKDFLSFSFLTAVTFELFTWISRFTNSLKQDDDLAQACLANNRKTKGVIVDIRRQQTGKLQRSNSKQHTRYLTVQFLSQISARGRDFYTLPE